MGERGEGVSGGTGWAPDEPGWVPEEPGWVREEPGWAPDEPADEGSAWQDVAPGVRVAADGSAHWDWWATAVATTPPRPAGAGPDPEASRRVASTAHGAGRRARRSTVVVLAAVLGLAALVLAAGAVGAGADGPAGTAQVAPEPTLGAAPSTGASPSTGAARSEGSESSTGAAPSEGPESATGAAPSAGPASSTGADRGPGSTGPALDRTTPPTPGPDPAAASPGATASPDWWAVLAELDERRSRALASTDPALLADAVEPGSPAWAADTDTIEQLVAAGLAPVGLRTTMVAIESAEEQAEEPPGPGSRVVRLHVVDRRSAYTLVDSGGQVVREEPAAPQRRWRITLVPVDTSSAAEGATAPAGEWRVRAVEALP